MTKAGRGFPLGLGATTIPLTASGAGTDTRAIGGFATVDLEDPERAQAAAVQPTGVGAGRQVAPSSIEVHTSNEVIFCLVTPCACRTVKVAVPSDQHS